MIKFINPELFHLETTIEKGTNGDFYKTVVSSAIKVPNQKTGEKTHRIITTILSDTEKGYEDPRTNVGIKSTLTKNGTTRISLNVFDNVKYNTNVYLAAIPFNGFIEEIEKSFQYRIYRGIMIKSDKRTIEFNGETFKKIAYLIIVPNEGMLEENHKYHTDALTLKVSSYNLETREDGEHDTTKYTTTLSFSKKDSVVGQYLDCDVDFAKENVEPVSPEDFTGKTIFPIYTKDAKPSTPVYKDDDKESHGGYRKPKKDNYYNKNPYDRMKQTNKKTKKR